MSKQTEAKRNQGYIPNVVERSCSNCANLKCYTITQKHALGEFVRRSNQRCGIGGFAVKLRGTCDNFTLTQRIP